MAGDVQQADYPLLIAGRDWASRRQNNRGFLQSVARSKAMGVGAGERLWTSAFPRGFRGPEIEVGEQVERLKVVVMVEQLWWDPFLHCHKGHLHRQHGFHRAPGHGLNAAE